MGGGDLNLKKSWHPKTMKNQEKVWKVEQKTEMEKKKVEELQREIQSNREKEQYQDMVNSAHGGLGMKPKMDWMYEGVSGLVDREDYLLGRKVDKTFDVIQAAEEGETAPPEKSEGLPSQLFKRKENDSAYVPVDMATKVREDPLYLIKKQEYNSKKQLLSNPIRMKMLQDMISKQEDKSKKKHKKHKKDKRKNDSDSGEDEDIDAKILKYKEKLFGDKADRSGSEEEGGKRHGRDEERRDRQQGGGRKSPKRALSGDRRSPRRRSSREPESRMRRDPSRERGRGDGQTRRDRRGDSRDRPNRSGDSRDRRANSRDRVADSRDSRNRRPGSGDRKNRRDGSRERRSVERHDSRERGGRARRPPSTERRNRSEERHAKKRDSRRDERETSRDRSAKSKRDDKLRDRSDSKSPPRKKGFGLIKMREDSPTGEAYVKVDYRALLEERKRKEEDERKQLEDSLRDRRSRKLTQQEKEERLREMQQDAEAREKQRHEYVKRHTKADAIEVSDYREGGFKGAEMLSKAVESSTVERRLKSNIRNAQRSSRAMESNFLRK